MSDVLDAIRKLSESAAELDRLSGRLAQVERELEPLQAWYDDYSENFVAGLFEDDSKRLPGEDVRRALVHKDMREKEPEKFGHRRKLASESARIEKRIKALNREVDAQRSILSAEKELASV